LAREALRRPKTVGAIAILAALAAASGAHRLEVETDFTRNFRDASPVVTSYRFVETHLGGAGVWDVILPAEEYLGWNYLKKAERLEARLRKEVVVPGPNGEPRPGLTKVLSLDGPIEAVMAKALRIVPGGVRGRNVVVGLGLDQVKSRMPALAESLYAQDPQEPGSYYYRIMLRARERQPSAQKRSIISQVETIARQEFPATQNKPGAEVTGFFVLLTNLIDSMLRDQWAAFGVATLGIGLMMLVAFRSPILAVVTLVPNVLPILVVTGLMGWAGLKINMGAAMIAAVSMGLSIDSSIHYVAAFRLARGQGHSLDDALAIVQKTVGRAMVFSTLALIVGFTVLATSQFVPTVYFGVLVSLAMLGGLAGNLVVLPVLLKLTSKTGLPRRGQSE
jgi:predicted RND superfamily exporter protein